MADGTVELQVNNSQALRALNQVKNEVGELGAQFNRLTTAIGAAISGAAIGQFIARTREYALAITQASNATGIGISTIQAFTNAIVANGGSANEASENLVSFVTKLNDAANGSAGAQIALAKVGVTLDDLRKLSTQDIFVKVLRGLNSIEDEAKRNKLAIELLGESFKKVDIVGVTRSINTATRANEAAITSAANAQRVLNTQLENFKNAVITATKPLNDLISQINITQQDWEKLLDVLSRTTPVLSVINGNWREMLYNLLPLSAALDLIIQKTQELMGPGAGAGRGPMSKEQIDELRRYYEEQFNLSEAERKNRREVVDAQRGLSLESANVIRAYQQINNEQLSQIKYQTSLVGLSDDQIERLQFQQQLNATYSQQLQNAMNRFIQLKEAASIGTDEDKARFAAYAAGYRTLLANIDQEYKNATNFANDLVNKLQSAKIIEQDRLRTIDNITRAYEEQSNRIQTLGSIMRDAQSQTGEVLFEREQLGRGPIQQQIAAAYESARRSALEAQRQFAETFGDADGLTPERMAELVAGLDAIAAAFKNLAFQTENNILLSQQWSTGWKDAYETFVDNALNAADRAREVFNGMVSSMENALDNFVRTGKLNFRDLINSMIADLMSAALRQAFRNLLMATSGGGGGGWLSSLGRFFAGFFANGGFIPPGKAGIVGERGPELVQGPAQVTPLGGMSAPINNYYTYNINALDAKSVAQLFSENRRTLLGVTEQARKEMPIRQRF